MRRWSRPWNGLSCGGSVVARVTLPSGDEAALVTRYEDGATAVCNMAAANRDESAFDAAGEMDLRRSPNPHLAFGAGAHACLGQPLARTELQVVLDVLLRRLPSLELAVAEEDLRRVEGLVVGGLSELPVRW
jgi:cytochrome P450